VEIATFFFLFLLLFFGHAISFPPSSSLCWRQLDEWIADGTRIDVCIMYRIYVEVATHISASLDGTYSRARPSPTTTTLKANNAKKEEDNTTKNLKFICYYASQIIIIIITLARPSSLTDRTPLKN
jgi:hypothetical protein